MAAADWCGRGGGRVRPNPDMSGGAVEKGLGFGPENSEGEVFIWVEGARSVQMRCDFRPRDRDQTTERMEGVYMGFGPLWRGVGL